MAGIELERQEAPPLAGGVAAPEIRARRREDQRQVLPQHAVLGQVLDVLERRLDRALVLGRARAGAGAAVRIEARAEQLDQQARDVGVRGERGLDERLRQREADLPHVLRVRAQHDDLFGGNARGDDQPVEVVALDFAAEDAAERILEHLVQRVDLHVDAGQRRLDAEVVHGDRRHPLRRDPVRMLVEHPQAHVLEHRQAVRQRDRAPEMHELEAQHAGRRLERPVQAHRQRLARR